MRNRALIARWTLAHANGAVTMEKHGGKTYVAVHDYVQLRQLFARLLAEVQRIKSEGDYEAARLLVEQYAIDVNPLLHEEILRRYSLLNLAPYKGFLNPWMIPATDSEGRITDISLDYSETFTEQMLRYSKDYSFLIS